jgi:hypothetical protein
MSPLLTGALFLVFFFGLIAYGMYSNKKHREAMRNLAVRFGWIYHDSPPQDMTEHTKRFELFNQGRSRVMSNVLTGERSDFPFRVFDYQYRTGSGKSSQTHFQTVILVSAQKQSFPEFIMVPETFLSAISEWFGCKDIDFNDYPVFSKKYFLRSSNETGVRQFFTPAIINYFENNLFKENLAVSGTDLIMYNPVLIYKPEEIPTRLDQAINMVKLFGGIAKGEQGNGVPLVT